MKSEVGGVSEVTWSAWILIGWVFINRESSLFEAPRSICWYTLVLQDDHVNSSVDISVKRF